MSGAGADAVTTVVLSIGANLGDRAAALRSVLDAAAATGGLRAWSGLWETPPWGPVPQDDFLNAVVIASGRRSPQDWLRWAQGLERARDRRREVRWGPRTLDVDLVQVRDADGGELTSDSPELTLPHPRAAERAFVLVPWLEVEPDATLAGRPTAWWAGRLDDGERAGVRPAPVATAAGWPDPGEAS